MIKGLCEWCVRRGVFVIRGSSCEQYATVPLGRIQEPHDTLESRFKVFCRGATFQGPGSAIHQANLPATVRHCPHQPTRVNTHKWSPLRAFRQRLEPGRKKGIGIGGLCGRNVHCILRRRWVRCIQGERNRKNRNLAG